jgi:hypothetical protein
MIVKDEVDPYPALPDGYGMSTIDTTVVAREK